MFNCKLIYTSNTNPGILMYINKEGKIVFGEEVIYFYDYKYDDYYSFKTSKIVSAKKEKKILTVKTLNSTYIFELYENLKIPDYQVSKEFYEEHQKRMNTKSTKFLTKSIDGFINIIEIPKAMTKKEVIEYFKEKKIFVDFVLAPIEKEFIIEDDETNPTLKK